MSVLRFFSPLAKRSGNLISVLSPETDTRHLRMHNTYPLDCSVPLKKSQLKTLWNTVSSDLRAELGDSTFDLWFTDFKLAKIENGEVTLRAPGSMYSIWVEENFKESLIFIFNKYLSS